MTDINLVAIDEGAGRVKLAYRDKTGKLITQVTSSLVIDGAGLVPIKDGAEMGYADTAFQTKNKKTYSVNPNAAEPYYNLNPELYQTSEINLIATHYALAKAGFGGKKVAIASSLPLELFFNEDGVADPMNRALIEAKKEKLKTPVSPLQHGAKPTKITDVIVVPEAISAWRNLMFDEAMKPKDKNFSEQNRYIILDIGESTTDAVQLYGGGDITPNRWSFPIGVGHVLKELQTAQNKKGENSDYALVGSILRNRTFNGNDCGSMVDAAIKHIYIKLELAIEKQLEKANTSQNIFVIGGGANVFGSLLKERYPNVIVPKNPDTILAETMLLLLESAKNLLGNTAKGDE